jgi:hypothetical protein
MATTDLAIIETDRRNIRLHKLGLARTSLRGIIDLGGFPDHLDTALLAAFQAAVKAWNDAQAETGR